MNTQPPIHGQQQVPAKVVLATLAGVAYVLLAMVVSQVYSKLIGGLMFVPVVAAVIISVFRLSREQKEQIAKALEKRDATPFGQIMKIVNLAVILLVVFAALRWAYGYLT